MNRQRREWIVLGALFVLALLPLRLTARSFPHLTLTMYNSRVWQAQDGLPQDTIQALAQTPDVTCGWHERRTNSFRWHAVRDLHAR